MPKENFLSRRTAWQNRIAEEVANGVAERVREGTLAPGAPLPGPRELAGTYATGDRVAERAIDLLLDMGLAERDAEGKLIVARTLPRPDRFEIPTDTEATRADVVALLELRLGIEAEAAAMAARRHTPEQLAAIRDAAAGFEKIPEGDAPARADFEFHRAVAEATGNPYVLEFVDYLGPLMIPRMRPALAAAGALTQADLDRARQEHRAIIDAIAARDPDAARAAMHAHLGRVAARLRGQDG